LSGLQFTTKLGDALALLTKHGLHHKRKKSSPVEVALESLLDQSPLRVAEAPDMNLESSVNHFLSHCASNNVPVGQVLRSGSQHVVKKLDISTLHETMKKCLQWARDPARPPIANTTFDEAAAIQLYTQQSCLYPRLNSALREHANPEKLAPFLPYLKLLLTGLNKLPLVRAQVYRGVALDLHEQYNQLEGKVFTWWAFSSTTRNKKLMCSSGFLGNGQSRTLFTIDAIGVDIAAFSAFPNESELLLLPGTSLTVKPGVNVESNFWKFEASVGKAAKRQPTQPTQPTQQHQLEQRQRHQQRQRPQQQQQQQQQQPKPPQPPQQQSSQQPPQQPQQPPPQQPQQPQQHQLEQRQANQQRQRPHQQQQPQQHKENQQQQRHLQPPSPQQIQPEQKQHQHLQQVEVRIPVSSPRNVSKFQIQNTDLPHPDWGKFCTAWES